MGLIQRVRFSSPCRRSSSSRCATRTRGAPRRRGPRWWPPSRSRRTGRLKHGAEDAESRAAEERLRGERLLLEASSAADRERHELRAAAEAAERKLCAAEALDVAAAAAKGEAAELARSRRRLHAEQEGVCGPSWTPRREHAECCIC